MSARRRGHGRWTSRVIDLLHKGIYAFAAGAVADRLIAGPAGIPARAPAVGEAVAPMGAASPAGGVRRTVWSGVMLGLGIAGTLDEVVLHQLLHWHHFYDRSTPAVGLISDGLFHITATVFLLLGMYRLGQHRGNPYTGWRRYFWAGVLLGIGGFNLYDGIIQHKVLRLHQVRPGVANELPYDLTFIGIASRSSSPALASCARRRPPPPLREAARSANRHDAGTSREYGKNEGEENSNMIEVPRQSLQALLQLLAAHRHAVAGGAMAGCSAANSSTARRADRQSGVQ